MIGPQSILYLLMGLLAVLVGISYGLRFYGALGGVAGVFGGLLLAVLAVFVAELAAWPFKAFGRWWRPYPPPCPDCAGPYRVQALAAHAAPALSSFGWQGACGALYAGTHDRRWVRVLPDGSVQRYLIHSPWGRWRPDVP